LNEALKDHVLVHFLVVMLSEIPGILGYQFQRGFPKAIGLLLHRNREVDLKTRLGFLQDVRLTELHKILLCKKTALPRTTRAGKSHGLVSVQSDLRGVS
jgi:hypothetical protein